MLELSTQKSLEPVVNLLKIVLSTLFLKKAVDIMKKLWLWSAALIFLLTACKKNDDWPPNKRFTVEGYLIHSGDDTPYAGEKIALSQSDAPKDDDPLTVTDSTGYFKISYIPSGSGGVMLHPWYSNYNCIFVNIAVLQNIPKGQNVNLGKIYLNNWGVY